MTHLRLSWVKDPSRGILSSAKKIPSFLFVNLQTTSHTINKCGRARKGGSDGGTLCESRRDVNGSQKRSRADVRPDFPPWQPTGHHAGSRLDGKGSRAGRATSAGLALARNPDLAATAAPAGHASTCRTAAGASRPRGTTKNLTSVRRCANPNRCFRISRTRRQPARPRQFPPQLLLGSEISTVFLAGGGHSRRGCCARSVIPGSVHGARGVDSVSGFLARVSPPRSQVGARSVNAVGLRPYPGSQTDTLRACATKNLHPRVFLQVIRAIEILTRRFLVL